MINYRLEHIFSFTARVQNPSEVIGPVPEGIRANFYTTGGEVNGPRVRGKIRPVGGDWLTIRTDGVGILDVRVTIETHDGALIYVTYQGVLDLGEDGYQKFLHQTLPPIIQLRVVPRFLTTHPNYQWLNRLQCLGIGESDVERNEVRYDVYAVQ
ncbi:MAG: DUF3237 domain-containing protein [Deltaproteobacteria bacterium]|nr:DUF3237 domain-containing protein [Deltaproteobacteria bacterium]